jgi:serine/threonine protein kinase
MRLSREDFLEQCERLSVVTREKLDFARKAAGGQWPVDADACANVLVDRGLLTRYQADEIGAGRGARLVMGAYDVLDKLGQGGMGVVLRARHRKMNREVALKVLAASQNFEQDAVDRFERETLASAKLQHPHIVTAFDAGEADGRHYLVMELVDGEDLGKRVRNAGPLPVTEAVSYLLQTAQGLEYAHQQKVVHRDIKPSNLMRDLKGNIKILDLGLARIERSESEESLSLTGTGATMGTADFMAPEQARNAKLADSRSDVYSLGATLWFLLTGRTPFDGDSLTAKLLAHQADPIPDLGAAVPEAGNDLCALFQRMLAKKPADRPQSMAEVISVLEVLAAGSTVPTGSVVKSKESTLVTDVATAAILANAGSLVDQDLAAAAQSVATITEGDSVEKEPGTIVEKSDTFVGAETRVPRNSTTAKLATSEEVVFSRSTRFTAAIGILLIGVIFFVVPTTWPNRPRTREAPIPPIVSSEPSTDVAVKPPNAASPPVVANSPVVSNRSQDVAQPQASPIEALQSVPEVAVVLNASGRNAAPLSQSAGNRGQIDMPMNSNAQERSQPNQSQESPPKPVQQIPAQNSQSQQTPSRQSALANRDAGERLVVTTEGIDLPLRWCPPGSFTMGSPKSEPDRQEDEDQVRVTLTKGFWMGETEVSQELYESVIGTNPSNFKGPRGPVEQVSWEDAMSFCVKLTERERNASRLSSTQEYRLPTEAEWEYACRAGTTTATAFGDTLSSEQANFDGNFPYNGAAKRPSLNSTREVGKYAANAWGLKDMHGNVFEWCADWYVDKLKGGTNPIADARAGKENRVLRGGSWLINGLNCRSSNRSRYTSGDRFDNIGFRCLRTE